MEFGRSGMGAAVCIGAQCFVFGGETWGTDDKWQSKSGVYAATRIYDTVANKWYSGPDMPQGKHGFVPVLDQKHSKIWLAGGGVRAFWSQSKQLYGLDIAVLIAAHTTTITTTTTKPNMPRTMAVAIGTKTPQTIAAAAGRSTEKQTNTETKLCLGGTLTRAQTVNQSVGFETEWMVVSPNGCCRGGSSFEREPRASLGDCKKLCEGNDRCKAIEWHPWDNVCKCTCTRTCTPGAPT